MIERVPVSSLRPNPRVGPPLEPGLEARVRILRAVLHEVYPQTNEEWLDGFRRDADPESEIRWWEHLAARWLEYADRHALDTDARASAFRLATRIMLDPGAEPASDPDLPPYSGTEMRDLLNT